MMICLENTGLDLSINMLVSSSQIFFNKEKRNS